jgi:hypothetical protein
MQYYVANTSTPQGCVDGGNWMLGSNQISVTNLTNYANNRLAIPSPYEIKVAGDLSNNSVTVQVKTISTPPTGTNSLRVAVIEKEYDWPSAPGSNGQTHFEGCLLDMLPNPQGTPITIAVGDSQTFTFNYNVTQVNFHPPSSLETLLAVVAFVQNDVTKEVQQTKFVEMGIPNGATKGGALIQNNDTAILRGFAFNNSNSPIDIDLGINGNIPSGWNVSAQTETGTLIPINSGTQNLTLQSSDTLYYDITVAPQGNSGGIILVADMSLTSNPNLSSSTNFSVATNDVDLLVVDDDGGNPYESYIIQELNKTSVNYGVLSINSAIGTIIWNCALAEPTLDEQDRMTLSDFLDNGGLLYLNGVDIAYELADPASPYYTTSSLDFFTNYLHSAYVMRSPTFLHATGIPNDPISGGISNIYLTGGTGAGTVTAEKKPNEINAADPDAAPCFALLGAASRYCGVRAVHNTGSGSGGVVFTTFGFETIADSTKRDILAHNILQWLDQITGIENGEPLTTADRFELKANYPNPFNPGTTISYLLPIISGDQNVSLVIFNQLGQKVRTLMNEIQGPGRHQISWNGLDDNGFHVASGVYFYQLKYGDYTATRKMLLVR